MVATVRSEPPPRSRARLVLWLLLLPVLYMGAQVWHHATDIFGVQPLTSLELREMARAPAADSPAFREALSVMTGTRMEPGHELELLVDGPPTISRLDADLRAATTSIDVQTYYCEPGAVTEWLKRRLSERAQAGVRVHFLRDGFGCESLTRGFLDSLQSAGVRVATIRPVHWWALHKAIHRSHVRIVTIDGRIGYAGGFGLADKWLEGDGEPRWRETAVRLTGPAVSQLTSAFTIGWAGATGELLARPERSRYDTAVAAGRALAGVMFTQQAYETSVPERYLALTLHAARSRVYIANSYFVPNRQVREWLVAAARRGVDVRVLVPGERMDVPFTSWAGRSTYDELLAGGVRIYEYRPAMMHAKTMVIDRQFVSVGSLNLDNVSLRINDEAVVLAHDTTLANTLAAQFERDLAQSREITRATLKQRSVYDRTMTLLARVVRDLL